MSTPHHVVVGAGAVGGVVGGLLQLAGRRVTLVARGDHLAALQRDGLRLGVGETEHHLEVTAVGDVAEVDWQGGGDRPGGEIVHLAVKSDATAGLAAALHRVAPPETIVSCLQNGVGNEDVVLRWFARVVGVCVMLPATHLEPGRVHARSTNLPAVLDCGRHPGGQAVDPVAELVARELRSAGAASVARPDIMAWKYRKLVNNLGNAVDAACSPGPEREELLQRVRQEGEEVLAAAGIEVVSAADDRARRGDLLQTPRHGEATGSSTWQSLARGTGTVEADWLNGEIVRIAHAHRRRAPVNDLLRRTVTGLLGGEPRSVDAADLLTRLDG